MKNIESTVGQETISAVEVREMMHTAIDQFAELIAKTRETGLEKVASLMHARKVVSAYEANAVGFWESRIRDLLERQGSSSEEAILTVALAAFESSSMAGDSGGWILFVDAFTKALESYQRNRYRRAVDN